MGDKTGIEWTDATWNPLVGCEKVSAGCDNCYAIPMSRRVEAAGVAAYDGITLTTDDSTEWSGLVRELPERLDQPLRWTRPRRVFVNSMSDLFHSDVTREFQAQVFAVMAVASRHTFQVLTKRPGVMRSVLSSQEFRELVALKIEEWTDPAPVITWPWPLPNVWLGTSVEDQDAADLRIPHLMNTPAAVRFLSMEPLLGPVDLDKWIWRGYGADGMAPEPDWVIVGGESGPGARPMHPVWVRDLRDQLTAAEIPFLFKQWGEWAPGQHDYGSRKGQVGRGWYSGGGTSGEYASVTRVGKKTAGRLLDGRTWDEFPA